MIRSWLSRLLRKKEASASAGDFELPAHHRPMGAFLQVTEGAPFQPLESLAAAQQHADAFVILQGDWGGQTYVLAPARKVLCSERALQALLRDLDKHQWACNEGEGAEIFFERLDSPTGLASGMGGGVASGVVWVHPRLEASGWGDTVRHVIGSPSG